MAKGERIMLIRINNREVEFNGNTIQDLIREDGLMEKRGIAIAVNDTVVPRNEWNSYEISENDAIIIIRPAQGG